MQKRYSKEFKETLIAFYHSGQSVTQLSKEYDVAPATIYKWIDLYSKSNESSVSKKFDQGKVAESTTDNPVWVHFGGGN
uniref:transposase n=1 Tax=Lactococcus lactis subsp. cremoris TaxID=1359 RepID=UPI0024A70810